MLREEKEGQWGEAQRAKGRVLQDQVGRVGGVQVTKRLVSHRDRSGFYFTGDGKSLLGPCRRVI